jgi:hypothetical protein
MGGTILLWEGQFYYNLYNGRDNFIINYFLWKIFYKKKKYAPVAFYPIKNNWCIV